ncbi:MAG: hypothetical protein IKE75_06205 [Bacilli bacterium]|nr:hypothetical protein [Bacilli bacterium]
MNFYNPYYMMYPVTRPSLFGAIRGSLRNINFSNIINNTQRTLNLVNQAIPLVKQVTPVMKNARTMFRVMNEFKKTESLTKDYNNYQNHNYEASDQEYDGGPKFFL